MMSASLYELMTGPEGKYLMPALGGRDPEARERYRAWLVERGDDRAELFAIEDALLRDEFSERPEAIARAQAILSRHRSIREWWGMLTRSTPIRNCGSAPVAGRPIRFAYECLRTWDTLEPTNEAAARHCATCAKLVHLCRSRDEAEERARRGECITLVSEEWSGLSREMTSGWTGRPDPVAIWADRVFPGERSDEDR
jgi:hypothetical protein